MDGMYTLNVTNFILREYTFMNVNTREYTILTWIHLRLCWAIIRIANCNIVIEETIFSCKCNNLQIRCFMYQNTNKWIYWSFLWPLTHRAHALNYTIYIKYMLSTNYFGRGWCLNGQILEQLLKLFCIRLKRSILQ